MPTNLLLLEDVEDLGRSGEVVSVKPGYARNFLIPKQKAVAAGKHEMRMQARLQEERAKQAATDRKGSLKISEDLEGKAFTTTVKVDPAGHMYGSVTVQDILALLSEAGFEIEKKALKIHHLKETGSTKVELFLKEGVETWITLEIVPEYPEGYEAPKVIVEEKVEAPSEAEGEAPPEAEIKAEAEAAPETE